MPVQVSLPIGPRSRWCKRWKGPTTIYAPSVSPTTRSSYCKTILSRGLLLAHMILDVNDMRKAGRSLNKSIRSLPFSNGYVHCTDALEREM